MGRLFPLYKSERINFYYDIDCKQVFVRVLNGSSDFAMTVECEDFQKLVDMWHEYRDDPNQFEQDLIN